ncbi:hypothetical protein Ciccas_008141 [Cichlidogyrus casuarinus]|uniref:COP9 signalosome complex subunit 3 n=1 Tax=Cichlidogyrus casuarinus TaxID=1844966 RepID=A0ABD2Q0T9_9PLAT
MVQAAVKQFDKSLQSFDNCLLMPTVVPSRILIEAAKKQILVSLIVHGRHQKGHYGGQIAASGPSESAHPWKRYITVYIELANIFRHDDKKDISFFIDTHKVTFMNDSNYGLVKQVQVAWSKNHIKNLTKTFITMSLADLASKVGLADARQAEKYLVEMIQSGDISAKICQQNGTVQFMDDQEQYDSAEMLAKINEKLTQCVSLEKYLNLVSDNITTSQAYAKWSIENEARTASKINL